MARIARRQGYGGGRGCGDRLPELMVYVVILGAIAYGVNWYLKVYLPSPTNVLMQYMNAVRDGSAERQYPLLSASTKRFFPTVQAYDNNWPQAHGLAAKITNYTITSINVSDGKAVATVSLTILRAGQQLYQASTDNYQDQYILVKEPEGWKVALDRSQGKLQSLEAARPTR